MTAPLPHKFPDSTIAMSVYNVVAQAPNGLTVDGIVGALAMFGHEQQDRRQLERCIAQLHSRGYVLTRDRVRVIDPKRRPVTMRDRTDRTGWSRWMARDPMGHYYPLDSIVERVRAGKRVT